MSELNWIVENGRQLSARSGEWDALVASLGYPAFLRSAFLGPAYDVYGGNSELLVRGYDANRPVFGALLRREKVGHWTVFQPSQLPLGACLISADYAWDSVLGSLARALPGYVWALGITQQDPRLAPRPQGSELIETLDYVPTGWVEVTGSFEDFWQGRGKNLRQNLRKQRRKLEESGQKLVFEYLSEPGEVDGAFRDFAGLESKGWKAGAGSAISIDNAQGRFYGRMLQEFSRAGRSAFAYRLSLGDKPVAVDFGIRDANVAIILKTTYDEDLKGASPGQLLHEEAFKRHFERGDVARIEFFGKMMEWHSRWTEQSRMLFHVNYFRSGKLRSVRDSLKRLVSRVKKVPAGH